MNTAAIYHRPDSEYAYLYTKDVVHIRLRTAKNDMNQVFLLSGDPYLLEEDTWFRQPEAMQKLVTTELYDYWWIEKTAPFHRLSYAFSLEDTQGQYVFYGEKGSCALTEQVLKQGSAYFRIPFFHDVDRVKAIDWVTKTVWYQIFPERFANGDPTNDPAGTLTWGSRTPERQDFFGGDLQGILDHLDYLTDLGINGLYLCPIFEAHSNHKYDTIDYYKVDPAFGTPDTLKALIHACHERGIKVMLDAVFNHIGETSPQWQDVIKNGANSPYADWFHIYEFPVCYTAGENFEKATALNYDVFAFTPHMPKLNTANPDVQNYLLASATYWIREFDSDAWRLDVANEVDHAFWKKFRTACRAVKPDVYILGEIWHSAQSWLQGDEFDAVMNYAYTDAILQYFVKKQSSIEQLISNLGEQLMLYRTQTNQMQLNVLDSHDTPRLLTEVNGDQELMKQLVAFTYLQPGIPCLYYGDEIGLTGGMDPACRKCMVWEEDQQNRVLYQFYQSLIQFRLQASSILSSGTIDWQKVGDGIVVTRKTAQQTICAYFNTGDEVSEWQVSGTVLCQNLATATQSNTYHIAPKGFLIQDCLSE